MHRPPVPTHTIGFTKGLGFALIAAIGFGLQPWVAKSAYAQGVTIEQLLFFRSIVLSLMFGSILALQLRNEQKRGILRPAVTRNTIIISLIGGVIGFYITPITDLHALTRIDTSLERVLLYTFPGFVLVFHAIAYRKRPALSQICALIIILLGIYLVTGGAEHEITIDHEGIFWVISSASAFAIYVLFNQRVTPQLGSLRFMTYAAHGAMIAIAAHVIIIWPFSLWSTSPMGAAYTLLFGIGTTFIPSFCFSEGIRRIGGARASLVVTLSPILTTMIGIWVLGESLSFFQMMGGLLVIGSVLSLELWALYQHKKPPITA
jgi:drug/metabolite transporter (DMT)-like permease